MAPRQGVHNTEFLLMSFGILAWFWYYIMIPVYQIRACKSHDSYRKLLKFARIMVEIMIPTSSLILWFQLWFLEPFDIYME